MAGRGLLETGKLYIQAVRRAGRDGLSMRLRLFGMLLLFLNAILMGFLLILFLTGTFHSGMQATRELLENELSYRAQNVYRSFGDILSLIHISCPRCFWPGRSVCQRMP